jgi:hypothetical protein
MLDKKSKGKAQERIAAIRRSLELACQLIEDNLDREKIRTQYSQLLYQREIADNLDLSRRYEVTQRIAQTAVGFAIRGYDGELYYPFDGLFSTYELEKIEKDHVARRNDEIYLRHAGLYSQDNKTRKIISKMALEKRGIRPLSPEEIQMVLECSRDPNYCHTNGKSGKPNLELISVEVNNRLHQGQKIRNKKSIGNIIYRYRDK